jgi:hypothetical protein
MKAPLLSMLRLSLIAGVSMVVFAGAADAQQKTAKACEAEWRANKATIQSSGKKKVDFMKDCRASAVGAAPTTAQQPPATTAQQSPPAQQPAPSPRTAARDRATARETAPAERPRRVIAPAGQFGSELEAKAHCPGQPVVWANLDSNVYHFNGSRRYGKTKHGAYMCERDTGTAGMRAAKNEKRP